MNKSFLKILGVLFILLFQFTSCLKMDDDKKPYYYFYDEPVVFGRTAEFPIPSNLENLFADIKECPYIRNESAIFYIPELADNSDLKEGDLLWSSFTVDLKDMDITSASSISPIAVHSYLARNFQYTIVDSAKVIIPADAEEFKSYLSDDFSESIELSVLYKYVIDNLWFFGFKHFDHSNNLRYTYELILDPEVENSNYPTFYIRAKQINLPTGSYAKDRQYRNIFAFDLKDFVNDYVINSNVLITNVRFNLKYKTGEYSNGNDIYKDFASNPISWNFNKRNANSD